MPRHNTTEPRANRPGTIMVALKGMTPELRKRFKQAVLDTGERSYTSLVERWVDDHERRQARAIRAQASPLHRPPPDNLDPSVVSM